jgi:hypothetical protein
MKMQDMFSPSEWNTLKAGILQPAPAQIINAIARRATIAPQPAEEIDTRASHLNRPFFCTCCEDMVDAVTTSYIYKGVERVAAGAALCRRCFSVVRIHKSLNRKSVNHKS